MIDLFEHRTAGFRFFLLWALIVGSGSLRAAEETSPAYDKEVRPILSQFCFKCHGPDDGQRQGELRLDQREGATSPAASGRRAIRAGDVESSELVRRILSQDADEQMPPPSTKFGLTDAQKSVLKRWIASGANYTRHWAFVPPVRPSVPMLTTNPNRIRLDSPIDSFVVNSLQQSKLTLSPEADRETRLRRASFDLMGLPPTIEEADAFLADSRPDAYERLLDRLQASPHYGERWGRKWLDLARYADTNGYEKDRPRTVWPYRDWVINAINADLPFDQFTVEQLAGDMLPNATMDQQIATGFHRNTMLNEEGGIDPLEFRFYAMTDRVATTATTWLGLTLGCAQCHTHKYDPITHRDYYGFFGLLNNADEPEREIVRPALEAKRVEIQRQIAQLEADLPNRFPLPDQYVWEVVKPTGMKSVQGAKLELREDFSVLVSGETFDTDLYEIQIDSDLTQISAIKLEVLTDPSLPSLGPGRTPHGNFVLSEITAAVLNDELPGETRPLKWIRAAADFSQKDFPVTKAIDGDTESKSGWAIATESGSLNVNRVATLMLAEPVSAQPQTSHWTIRLVQQFGSKHTLGKFRLSFGRLPANQSQPEAERRQSHFLARYQQWRVLESEQLAHWSLLQPVTATSDLPLLTIQPDGSILASGDQSKQDRYEIRLNKTIANMTALRIEVMPDPSLPRNGPGRTYYEGPFGDFFLSEVSLAADGQPVTLVHASHSFASGQGAAACLDGNQQTGWSIDGGQGRPHVAVFRFEKPIAVATSLDLSLLFEKYYAAGLGRFRVWVTDDIRPIEARSLPTELEPLFRAETAESTPATELVRYFCRIAPELAGERQSIEILRREAMAATTALVMQERPPGNPRQTRRHHRGEFLQPKESIVPAGLSMLPPLPPDRSANRLALAEWLVSPENPLTARVTVNRHWASLFGRGIVQTTEDFGSQGASPTHPELLDWLAVEFSERSMRGIANPIGRPQAWSIKRLHRLIMSSATYRQSSHVSAELLARDASNELLGRSPRLRLEGELVRDLALQVSGLLSEKLGGPSVFPAQPTSVTTEGTYGSLSWTVSSGEDRYRRSLYTFAKRTSPYAMLMTFDGPSGEACIARREVTNTPLQALTMLNDTIFIEAAQTLGREFSGRNEPESVRLQTLFRRCLTRPASTEELSLLTRYLEEQSARLQRKDLDAAAIAGPGDNAISRAAWTLVARALLNLDEIITRD